MEFLGKLTVLYVEDDADTREQFSEFLRRPVGTLITAANGAEGLEAFVKHSPDIVVTDIMMPLMDGLTMATKIKEIDPAVQIVVITAFESSKYLLQAIDIGIDKFVTKPVNIFQLLKCLIECAHRLRAEKHLSVQQQWALQEMVMNNQLLHDQLTIIFELSPAGIILGDLRGFISFANRRLAEMLGYQADELTGRDYLEYIHPDDMVVSMQKQQMLQAGALKSINDYRRFVRKDGTFFLGHIMASHFGDEGDNQRGMVCLVSDVTERNHTDDEQMNPEQRPTRDLEIGKESGSLTTVRQNCSETMPSIEDDENIATIHTTLLESYGGTETVLIVEADDDIMMMHKTSLGSYGYLVMAASDGDVALELFTAHSEEIELAIIDVNVPGMNGCAIAKELRRQSPKLPIIMVGGYNGEIIDQMTMYELGVVFLRKPVKLFDLLAAIRSCMRSKT
jgi:PAS domain S-box-containing protein